MQVREYRLRKQAAHQEMMANQEHPSRKPRGLQPILPLIGAKKTVLTDGDKGTTSNVSFELLTVASKKTSSKYKKYVRKFEEGSPQEWIDLVNNLEEIFN